MPYAKITYLPVDEADKAEFGDKNHLMQRWEGLTKSTLTQWLIEMRNNPKFKDGVINPTHKIVMINYEKFKEFVKWKEENRYKS